MKRPTVLSLSAMAFFGSFLSLQSSPPDGFKSFESKAKGLALFIPANFEELPVQPGEDFIQLKFTKKESQDPKDKDFRPEIWVISIGKLAPVTGPDAASQNSDEKKPEEKKPAPAPKIHSFEDYAKEELKNWTAKLDAAGDRAKEKKPIDRYSVIRKDGAFKGLSFVQDVEGRFLCLFAYSSSQDLPEYQKTFEKCARSLRATEIQDQLKRQIEAIYKNRPYRNVDYRTEVRQNLPKGWKADDTENYILIYDTKDEHLIAKIKNDLEAVRTKYLEIFPPVKEIEAVSTVRVCKDKDEFQKFSGMPPQVAGYWNPGTEELVFYDANADPTIHGLGRKDSYIVLYHEAFHQYIHYSCGEIAPHSWFNEGFGDYFSGSMIGRGGKKVDRLEVDPWRVGTVKKMVEENTFAPLKELVRFEQPDYYKKGGFYYAEGWALVYFLRESKAAKKHPVWSKILPKYFDTLKSTYKDELVALGKDPPMEKVFAAQLKARKKADDVAFEGVDFDQLEKEWIDFVGKLKDPLAK